MSACISSRIYAASQTRISSRKAVLTAHPDKGGSEAKMAAVNEAYEVLSNPGTFTSYRRIAPEC